jgi:hypothetical protein
MANTAETTVRADEAIVARAWQRAFATSREPVGEPDAFCRAARACLPTRRGEISVQVSLRHDTCLGNPVGKDDSSSDGALCLSTGSGGVR